MIRMVRNTYTVTPVKTGVLKLSKQLDSDFRRDGGKGRPGTERGDNMKTETMKKTFVTFLGVLAMSLTLMVTIHARIITLSNEELVRQSEYVVVAQVYSFSMVETDPTTKIITLRNDLKVIESLKSLWPSRDPITLTTIRHEEHWIEDNVELPPPGTKVVLFLRKYEGRLVPVNGIQGVWPLRGRELLGMGTGMSLDQLREMIRSQKR